MQMFYVSVTKFLQLELNEKSTRLLKVEAELNSSKREIESLNALVQREAEELDKNRREAASWQAKVLHIQQDSNDAQVCLYDL